VPFEKKKRYRKIAFALSLCALILWSALGTGASLAWFADTSPTIKNVFNFAEFDLEVSYRDQNGNYIPMDSETELFDENALYEPGYVQIVYLKIKNNGTVPFDCQTSVILREFVPGINVFGQPFQLQDHLRFGMVSSDAPEKLHAMIETREMARKIATVPLNTIEYQPTPLDSKTSTYLALIIQMPQEVGNIANYRVTAPEVKLGVSITATQQH